MMKETTDTVKKYYLRDVIGTYMRELGARDERVVVVNADLMGTCRNRGFCEEFPRRSFNVGIAEQNLVSFAAGLAHEGLIPYVFSMAPFISMRACEQCRTDVAYENLNVRFIATYAGVSGGISGATHWGMEDCAIMSAMPNMTVLEASDPVQARRMLDATLCETGPIYMRSGVEAVAGIYPEDYACRLGRADVVREGSDGTFIASGIAVGFALEAAERLRREFDCRIRVVDMHTLKPVDEGAILSAAQTKGPMIALQDHSVTGGLGTAVASVLARAGIALPFQIVGIPDRFEVMAHAPYLYQKFGMDAAHLFETMRAMLNDTII